MLEGVGIGPLEERAYEALIAEAQPMPPNAVAGVLGVSDSEAARALGELEARGLATRARGRQRRFTANAPDFALEGLILKQQELIETARVRSHALQERFIARGGRVTASDLVEVVDRPELVLEHVNQIWLSAREEVLVFDKPPYVYPSPPFAIAPRVNAGESAALARGVRVRLVYDRTALELKGGLEAAWRFMREGEDARAQPQLPFKLLIADGATGIIPLVIEDEGRVGGALVLRRSHLLEALVLLFEIFWERAVPLPPPGADLPPDEEFQLSDADRRILSFLVTGMKAQSIARATGLGRSTVERHVVAIMTRLGAETRVQLGFRLARLGILDESRP